jgi:hypothetical protein
MQCGVVYVACCVAAQSWQYSHNCCCCYCHHSLVPPFCMHLYLPTYLFFSSLLCSCPSASPFVPLGSFWPSYIVFLLIIPLSTLLSFSFLFFSSSLTSFPFPLSSAGMSFSKRQSKWANSALVVSVTPEDMKVSGRVSGEESGLYVSDTERVKEGEEERFSHFCSFPPIRFLPSPPLLLLPPSS